MKPNKLVLLPSSIFTLLFLIACSNVSAKKTFSSPSIEGSYTDNYGNSQIVGAEEWITAGSSYYNYIIVDNNQSYLTAQNASSNQYYPNKYSRFEWTTTDNGDLWYCQQVYNADSAADANDFTLYPPANSTDPSVRGCGTGNNDFPWSQLIPD